MAMPQPGLNAQQAQNWASSFQSNLRRQGQNPAQFGFGQAQPIQPQSQGTPYGGPNGSWVGGGNQLSKNGYGEWTMAPQANFGNDAQNTQPQGAQPKSPAVRPGDPRTGDPSLPPPTTGGKLPPARQQPFSAWNQTPNPFGQQFGGTFTPGGGAGNMAYALPDQRPQPFTQNTTFGGQQFGNMGDAFAMRDAFVQSVNQAKAPFAQQWGSGNPTAPNLDFDALMRQAGDMVKSGWTNPLVPGQAQPIQPPSRGTPYGGGDPRLPPFDADYAKWRGQQVQTMEYRGPEGEAARERAMRQRYERERGGDRPPSQDAYYPGDAFFPPAGPRPRHPARPPSREGFGRDPVGMPVLKAPEVWTNPSDPDWLKNELRSKPDTRPVVWDERNNRYINNPTFVGAPGYEAFLPQRPSDTPSNIWTGRPSQPAQRPLPPPGFAYTRR